MQVVSNRRSLIGIAAAGFALCAVLAFGPRPEAAPASSHREAPVISEDPTADNTDVYAFVSPDRRDSVTVVANYVPLEEPAGGPNFAKFGDDVLYALHVDSDGDAEDDVTYEFRFRTQVRNPDTFLYNTGPITSLTDPDWNIRQTYSVTRVQGAEPAGARRGPAHAAGEHRAALDPELRRARRGGRVGAAGRRQGLRRPARRPVLRRPRLGLRPGRAAAVQPVPRDPARRHGRRRRRPRLQHPHDRDPGADGAARPRSDAPTIGVYASASRQKVTIIREDGMRDASGAWQQVSRLANPLVNEVVIPLGRKDRWNASEPEDDAQFAAEYTEPEVTALENLLYPVLDDAPTSGRGDLVAVLLTGVPGVNFTGSTQADLIRLNTSIAPTAPVGAGNRLGAVGGDLAGFPNGRRLEDDTPDIELRAFACGYGAVVGPIVESFGFCGGNANRTPNNMLGDGVDANDKPFLAQFPYLATPHQGYES